MVHLRSRGRLSANLWNVVWFHAKPQMDDL